MSERKIGTTCVQGGYTPGNGEPRQIPIVQSTTFKYNTSEDMGKIWKQADISIHVFRIPQTTMWRQRSQSLKVERQACLHPPVRRQISLRFLIYVNAEAISYHHLLFTAALSTLYRLP